MERRRGRVLRLMIRLSWQYLLLLLLLYDRGPVMVSGRPVHRKAMQIQGPIKTIVVLVMENRSFDHILGWMKTMQPDLDGVTGRESNRVNPSDPNSPLVYFSDRAEFVDPDPGHSFQAIRDQVFGPGGDTRADPPPMDGFAVQAETIQRNLSARVMAGFRPEVLPVYAALAMEFAVCDRWFAAMPASTQPNRLFVHSGTSHGATGNVASQLAAGYPQRTIFDSVHDAGLSFGVYYQNLPTVLFYRNLRQLKYVTRLIPYGPYFRQHARAGTLPNYVVIEPRYFDVAGRPANDDHPSHDVAQGQQLVKEVYETLRASPQWNQTLLVVTYDEHGGFFDHVPTPVRGVPSPDGIVGPAPFNFAFDRLGVRVPAFLISPWINKGTVLHTPSGPSPSSQFEHSSLPATVKKLFNLPSPFLTRRDAWAGTFESLLYQRSTPRTDCPEVLPNPPWSLRHSPPDESRATSEFQQELVQLAAAIRGRFSADAHELPPMNVKEANDFVEDAVARFMEAGKAAAQAGLDEETIINPV